MRGIFSLIKTDTRLALVIASFVCLYIVVGWRLYDLQVRKNTYYRARAASAHSIGSLLDPERGKIFFTDKNNNQIPAGINKNYAIIFAVPKEIDDVEEVSARLGELLRQDSKKIKTLLSKKNDRYELLVRKAGAEDVARLEAEHIKGVYVTDENLRYYPFGPLASQVIGYVGPGDDGRESGRYGIEQYDNDLLLSKAVLGKDDVPESYVSGSDIYLTIDRNLQAEAEDVLTALVKTREAQGGTVLIADPKTGAIYALANMPSFDPNDYAAYPINNFLNPAVQAIYEPGSIFKVITMAGAIDAGKITPDTMYDDMGEVTLNGKTIKNWDHKAHGRISMTNVIEQSVNTGAVFAENKLGNNLFYNYLRDFGFKAKTGIDLPGEVAGSLRPLEKNISEINYATASFGQGVSVTPISLLGAIAAIANDGVLMKPYVMSDKKPQVVRRVISKHAATAVKQMMISAVDKAEVAHIDGYSIAGKTGTAQLPDFTHGGYTLDVVNTYVGFAPAFDPRFIILVKLDKPKGAPLAGLTVVPAFRELAEFVIQYLQIPPDRPTTK